MSGDARFPTTQWSLVFAAGHGGSEAAREALASLCARYWYPVFVFVRRHCHSSDDAQDLTQGFFTRLIEKGDVGDADRNRGRFRSFLLTACQHYVSNERDRAHALKRGGDRIPISIDIAVAEGRYQQALAHGDTPERLYERQWCLTLLESVLEDLRGEYPNQLLFERLSRFLVASEGSQSEVAMELGMTPGAVKVALHRMRRRYREALRKRVADTVENIDDIDDEIRALMSGL